MNTPRITLALLLLTALAVVAEGRETSYVYPPFKHTLGMHRVGEMELKLFLGPTARISNPQGLTALKLASRDDTKTDRDDDELTVLLVNSGRGEIIYNPSLTSVKRYGKLGSGEGEFRGARGIDVNRDGLVAVADTGNRRIVLLRVGAKDLEWAGVIDDADGPFSPTDVAFSEGFLWAADYAGNRILRFKADSGAFVDVWDTGGEPLERPLTIAVQGAREKWNHSRRFSLLVVDRDGTRIRLFGSTGQPRKSALAADLLDGPVRLGYPVIDLHGQFLLPDSLGGRILKLDRKLGPLRVLDRIDDDDRPLDHPNSLALNRRFGQLFVVEARGGSYAWTGTAINGAELVPAAEKERRGIQLEFELAEPSLVTVLLTTDGREHELIQERRRGAGQRREWIDLRDFDDADLVGASVILRAKPTYSARKQLTVERRLTFPARFRARRAGDEGSGP